MKTDRTRKIELCGMIQSPPPLRPEEIPNELKCSICFDIPLKPKLTPCEHLFCKDCIQQALDVTPSCPNCRTSCNTNQIRHLKKGTFIYRVWSGCLVKCVKHEGGGCSWTGSIVDFPNHFESCDAFRTSRNSLEQLTRRFSEIEKAAEEKVQLLENNLTASRQNNHDLQKKIDTFSKDSRLNLPILFKTTDGSNGYHYDRFNVVKLSQLISRYLENKPHQINSNRIYQCVEKCNKDFQHDWVDNPEHYHVDMRMLMTTCAASTWFTNRQSSNIRTWLQENNWS